MPTVTRVHTTELLAGKDQEIFLTRLSRKAGRNGPRLPREKTTTQLGRSGKLVDDGTHKTRNGLNDLPLTAI